MKKLFYLISILLLNSCTVYNEAYTGDDLYFSVPRTYNQSGYVDLHDRYLTMKSRNSRWNTFDDDFWYWNSMNSRTIIMPFYQPYTQLYSWRLNNNWNYNQFDWRFNNWNYMSYQPYRFGTFQSYNNIYQPNYTRKEVRSYNSPKHNAPRQFNLNSYNSSPSRTDNQTSLQNNSRSFAPQNNNSPVRTMPSQSAAPVRISNGNAPVRKF